MIEPLPPEASQQSADFVEARPLGSQLWLPGLGRSMFPVLLSGDALRVRRCQQDELREGDVAVLRLSKGRLVAHLVIGTAPFQTSGFLSSAADPPGGRVLGQVVAVRRRGLTVPLPRPCSQVLSSMHRAAVRALVSPSFRRGLRGARAALVSPFLQPLRRRVASASFVRALLPGEYAAAEATLRMSLPEAPAPRDTQTIWVGASPGGRRIVGVAIAREGDLFAIAVSSWRRRLGIGTELVERLCREGAARGWGELRARGEDARAQAFLAAAGFGRAEGPADWVRPLARKRS